jgi:hypothetical protein
MIFRSTVSDAILMIDQKIPVRDASSARVSLEDSFSAWESLEMARKAQMLEMR